jgi:hypothetical protein
MHMAGKPIGELNGKWALLLKIGLASIPVGAVFLSAIAVPWTRWVTTELGKHEASVQVTEQWKLTNPGFTLQDANNLRLTIKDEVGKEMVKEITVKLDNMQQAITRLESAVEALKQHRTAANNGDRVFVAEQSQLIGAR